ncbi:MAG: 6,7-dimethyl-8-ribityllumazine synthase [bacterium]|nr:6,7-dimethyl-8-ribityllumazine synthase [bacterium]
MTSTISGMLDGTGKSIAIVASRFNSIIVDRLISGAQDTLVRHGVDADAISLFRVPGAWELPMVCRRVVNKGSFDAVLALGCVIRGGTDHYDHVAREAATGLAQVALESEIPVVFGVLTCHTLEQAIERAGGKAGNQGSSAALTALELISLLEQI